MMNASGTETENVLDTPKWVKFVLGCSRGPERDCNQVRPSDEGCLLHPNDDTGGLETPCWVKYVLSCARRRR